MDCTLQSEPCFGSGVRNELPQMYEEDEDKLQKSIRNYGANHQIQGEIGLPQYVFGY